MVELNCETDFVARNEQFHAIVERLSVALVQQAGQRCPDGGIDKLDREALQAIHADESGQTLKDLVALGLYTIYYVVCTTQFDASYNKYLMIKGA